ncbi:MAG TPA: Pvc16 family protein [Pyrinomonadaceae bacterium]|jgi:hypothetical protein|nr:Pvc16 family protein [Pyrinomonadaceae bacterium]
MIRDLSETLRALLDDAALAAAFPELASAQILFERPSENFIPSQTTINLFLYDVRENMELRSNEPVITRNNGQATIGRPPMRVSCSYLVTAWPVGGGELALQEHRLLSQTLQVLSMHPSVPVKYLRGTLVGQDPPLPLMTSHADGLKNPAEFWTAIGNKMRPSLNVTVTISMETSEPFTAPLVTSSEIRLGERLDVRAGATRALAGESQLAPDTVHHFYRLVGQVTDAQGTPVAGASVVISSRNVRTMTDANGIYSLGVVRRGTYTLRVKSGSLAQSFKITVPAPAGSDFNVKLTG